MKTYTVPAKEIPVRFSADVVVCGGGVAGVHAAVAAAKEGRSVIVIEQFGSLGGSATNALVTPLMHSHIPGDPVCSYISPLLKEKLQKLDGVDASGRIFDPMLMRFACEQLCLEAGVTLLYYHYISGVVTDGRNVKGIITVSKSGEFIVEGKEFIDCTGDADVCVLAGCEYVKGDPENGGKCQPISLRYVVAGVDIPALGEFIRETAAKTVANGASYDGKTVYGAVTFNGEWTFTKLFDEAIAAGDLTPEDKMYWQMFMLPNKPGTLAFNNPEFFEFVDGTDSVHLTRAQTDGKAAILRQMAFYKKYLRGFENAFVSEMAEMVGIRESRNVVTEYVLTTEDIMNKRKFADAIGQTNYPVDVHGKNLKCVMVGGTDDGKLWYEIPYGSLVAKEYDNLFVAGRSVGADFVAQSSLRIMPNCRSTGEAAGIAASLCIGDNIAAKELDGKRVRDIMAAKGAEFR